MINISNITGRIQHNNCTTWLRGSGQPLLHLALQLGIRDGTGGVLGLGSGLNLLFAEKENRSQKVKTIAVISRVFPILLFIATHSLASHSTRQKVTVPATSRMTVIRSCHWRVRYLRYTEG